MSDLPAASPAPNVPPNAAPPLLVGARARSGMATLASRLGALGVPARVFGHPARAPANRDALSAAIVGTLGATLGWLLPEFAMYLGFGALTVTAALAAGIGGWPRASGWTVIVGKPSRATTRRLSVLALDVRRPRRWLFGLVALPACCLVLFPGSVVVVALAVAAIVAAAWDPLRARPISVEAAADWVRARAGNPAEVVLVSTAASGYGEGILAVVDWFELDRSALRVTVDEEGASGVVERLAQAGIGPKEGVDVVVGDRVRG